MSNIHRFGDHMYVAPSFCAAITAASVNGTSVDTFGYRRAAAIFTSNPSGAGTTSDCKLQEAPDNATWADVAGSNFTQQITANGEQSQILNIDLAKRQRYLRLVQTGAGAAVAGTTSGEFVLFETESAAPAQLVAAVSV